jgi:hypothetical protein
MRLKHILKGWKTKSIHPYSHNVAKCYQSSQLPQSPSSLDFDGCFLLSFALGTDGFAGALSIFAEGWGFLA